MNDGEPHPNESRQTEISATDQEARIEALRAKIALEIAERESQIVFYKTGGVMRDHFDQLDPAIVPGMIELFELEIEVLDDLVPQTSSEEKINAIRVFFNREREALVPKS